MAENEEYGSNEHERSNTGENGGWLNDSVEVQMSSPDEDTSSNSTSNSEKAPVQAQVPTVIENEASEEESRPSSGRQRDRSPRPSSEPISHCGGRLQRFQTWASRHGGNTPEPNPVPVLVQAEATNQVRGQPTGTHRRIGNPPPMQGRGGGGYGGAGGHGGGGGYGIDIGSGNYAANGNDIRIRNVFAHLKESMQVGSNNVSEVDNVIRIGEP